MKLYRIQLSGHLDPRWEIIFDGFKFSYELDNENQPVTVMTGSVLDQSALYGIMARLRNIGVELISIHSEEINDH